MGALIAKIDLEKTYDRIDWGFLESVTDTVGFQKPMADVIMNTIKSTTLSVIWNGDRLETLHRNEDCVRETHCHPTSLFFVWKYLAIRLRQQLGKRDGKHANFLKMVRNYLTCSSQITTISGGIVPSGWGNEGNNATILWGVRLINEFT